jgi:hypothetical protein
MCTSSAGGFDWDHRRPTQQLELFRKVSLAGTEPVGFRVKSDLRNHCAIVTVRPRLYDSALSLAMMATQIALGVQVRGT